MVNKISSTSLQVVVLLFALAILSRSTLGNPVCDCAEKNGKKKVVEYNVQISESGEKYTERIEVDQDKNTELFQVPAHPGVDRADVLHDFNQNLTMLRTPDQNTCYLFPLAKEQTTPEKLLRDLDKASGVRTIETFEEIILRLFYFLNNSNATMVVTESRRVDSTWILDGQLTDRSTLSEELAHFCAKYSIHHVKKTQDSFSARRVQAKGSHTIRKRWTRNINKLCLGGMDLDTAFKTCDAPRFKCRVQTRTCYKYVICSNVGLDGRDGFIDLRQYDTMVYLSPQSLTATRQNCREEHIWRSIVCCEYFCETQNIFSYSQR